ncbi:DUF1444 family protein [Lignipirellula cremea]|uniref:Beta-lactamase HcpC n=1 Tax=Lignipirellula cremea TaxID=2528010 RepID=A0A518DW48_9BACT|nr:DUF1444 family protein [Lignipirellula cremea]QDU96062.1 Putative beta-lactamase HcpC precursor [Lignipirellula cremea]
MGVTLFFAGQLRDQEAVKQVIAAARAYAAHMDWAAESLDTPSGVLRRLAGPHEPLDVQTTSIRSAQQRFENLYQGPVSGVAIYPHPDCEPIRLEFDADGYIQQGVKTQFAGPECHIELVALLQEIAPYFERFSVSDEGGYWESLDPEVLRSQFELAQSALTVLAEQDPHGRFHVADEEGRLVDFVDSQGQEVNVSVLPPGSETEHPLSRELAELMERAEADDPIALRELAVRTRTGVGVNEDPERAFALLRRAATLGDLDAQAMLGVCYRYGEGVDSNEGTALYWFRKTAESGNPLGQFMLGDCYKMGVGVGQDYTAAAKWFQKAAMQELADAQFSLGVCYYRGQGVPQDNAQAVAWLRKAADQGQGYAMNLLGECYRTGQGVETDREMAAQWYQLAAEQENPHAQFHLAEAHRTGQGAVLDYAAALRYYQLAAAQGHQGAINAVAGEYDLSEIEELDFGQVEADAEAGQPHALFLLGQCYYSNQYVPQNMSRAVEYWIQAAEQGHVDAMLMLSYCYRDGDGVEQNPAQATYWRGKAADLGHAGAILDQAFEEYFHPGGQDAQAAEKFREAAVRGNGQACNMLGECLLHGIGVEPHEEEAVSWFRRAAERSFVPGLVNLGDCLRAGWGAEQDECEAYRCYQKAATLDEENGLARSRLGDCCLEGLGVVQDFNKAIKWFQEAIALDLPDDGYSHLQLGRCYELFLDDLPDYAQAVVHYEQAVEAGSLTAAACLGRCFLHGLGVPQDPERAVELFTQSTAGDDPTAACELGCCHEYGVGVDIHWEQAVSCYRLAADNEMPHGMALLALAHLRGHLLPRDLEQAQQLLSAAADLDLNLAQWERGYCFALGLGVDADPLQAERCWNSAASDSLARPAPEAVEELRANPSPPPSSVEWIRSQAEQGVAWALNNLGVFFQEGYGVAADYPQAFACFTQAAEQGLAEAQDNLGNCYESGFGAEPQFALAEKWYRAAAEQGCASAQNSVGYFYYFGRVYEQDHAVALEWYRRAAAQGDGFAANRIGRMYETGHGVGQDYDEALAWRRKALDLGCEDAAAAVRRLEATLKANATDADRFAMLVMDALRDRGELRQVRYDREHFRLYPDGDEELLYINLDNFYREYTDSDDEHKNRVIERVARSWTAGETDIPATFEEVAPDLLPAVRPLSYFEFIQLNLRLEEAGSDAGWPHQVVGEHLGVGLVYDQQETMHFISDTHLQQWGVTAYEAFESALSNLRDLGEPIFAQPRPGVYLADCRDSYDASRIVLQDAIAELAVAGAPIAMLPNRETLAITGSQDEEGLGLLVELAGEATLNGRLIAELAFTLEEGQWTAWLPHVDSPLYHHFKRLQVRYFDRNYREQLDLFRQLAEQSGATRNAARFEFRLDQESQSLTSYCLWIEGAEQWLPEVDEVVFVGMVDGQPQVRGRCAWQRLEAGLEAVLAGLAEPQECYPPRLRTLGYPTEEQFETLALSPAPQQLAQVTVDDFATAETSEEGLPLLSTKRCGLFGHPEFVLPAALPAEQLLASLPAHASPPTDEAEVELSPLESLIEFLAIGENMVASGASFQAGQTLQFSWVILRVEKFDAVRLTIFEPDMKSWPIAYVPGVAQSLAQSALQAAALATLGLEANEAETPHMRQAVLAYGAHQTAKNWRLFRVDPNDEGDSGWRFECHDDPDALAAITEPETLSLYEMFVGRPEIVPFLNLPGDSDIQFQNGQLHQVSVHGEVIPLAADSFLRQP